MTRKTIARPAAASKAPPKAPPAGGIDSQLVREIAELLSESDLTEIEVEKGDLRIRVARQSHHVTHAPAPGPVTVTMAAAARTAVPAPPVEELAPADHPGAVKSPMVGTAYRRPSPESAAFIEIGSTVKAGDKLLLVEAMKTFNEIVAPRGGVVTAILIEDGQPVEYGQTLAIIE